MKYALPLLNALNDGAVIDLRFRIALQLLLSPGFVDGCKTRGEHPEQEAVLLAGNLVELAEKTDLIEPLPSHSDLPRAERAHVERQAAAQVFGQMHAQRVVNDESTSRVVPANGFRLNG